MLVNFFFAEEVQYVHIVHVRLNVQFSILKVGLKGITFSVSIYSDLIAHNNYEMIDNDMGIFVASNNRNLNLN